MRLLLLALIPASLFAQTTFNNLTTWGQNIVPDSTNLNGGYQRYSPIPYNPGDGGICYDAFGNVVQQPVLSVGAKPTGANDLFLWNSFSPEVPTGCGATPLTVNYVYGLNTNGYFYGLAGLATGAPYYNGVQNLRGGMAAGSFTAGIYYPPGTTTTGGLLGAGTVSTNGTTTITWTSGDIFLGGQDSPVAGNQIIICPTSACNPTIGKVYVVQSVTDATHLVLTTIPTSGGYYLLDAAGVYLGGHVDIGLSNGPPASATSTTSIGPGATTINVSQAAGLAPGVQITYEDSSPETVTVSGSYTTGLSVPVSPVSFTHANGAPVGWAGGNIAYVTNPFTGGEGLVPGMTYFDSVLGGPRMWYGVSGGGWKPFGGNSSAGGANTQIQVNCSGSFCGYPNLTWNQGSNVLSITGLSASLDMTNSTSIAAINVASGGVNARWLVTNDSLFFLQEAAPPLSASGQSRIYMDQSIHTLLASVNGGAYGPFGGGAGGSTTDVQFNCSSALCGDPHLTWDNTNYVLSATGTPGVSGMEALTFSSSATGAIAAFSSANALIYGNGQISGAWSTLTNQSTPPPPAAGYAYLYATSSALNLSLDGGAYVNIAAGAAPPGGDTDVIYNHTGSYAATSALTWNYVNGVLSVCKVIGGICTATSGVEAETFASTATGGNAGFNNGGTTGTFAGIYGNGQISGQWLAFGNQTTPVTGVAGDAFLSATSTGLYVSLNGGSPQQLSTSVIVYCAGTGTNTITCPGIPAPVAYTNGLQITLLAGGTNTGATTLNIASLGAVSVLYNGSALTSGQMTLGNLYTLYYSTTGPAFNLAPTGGGGTPAGANTQVQFNNSGAFGASPNLTWNGTTFSATNIATLGATGLFTSTATGANPGYTNGGTSGAGTIAAIYGNGQITAQYHALQDQSSSVAGISGYALLSATASALYVSLNGGSPINLSAGATVPGSNTNVIYNNSGTFGASSSFTFSSSVVTAPNFTTSGTSGTFTSTAVGGNVGYSNNGGAGSFAAIYGNGQIAGQWLSLGNQAGAITGFSGDAFLSATATALYVSLNGGTLINISSAATVPGTDQDVIYNNTGAYSASNVFTWNYGSGVLSVCTTIGGICTPSSGVDAQAFSSSATGTAVGFTDSTGNFTITVDGTGNFQLLNVDSATTAPLAEVVIGSLTQPSIGLLVNNDNNSQETAFIRNSGTFYAVEIISAGTSTAIFQNTSTSAFCLIQPATTALVCSSDERLKKNETSIADGLSRIRQLRPVTFEWRADPTGTRHTGFIAQEVEKILPDLVSTGEDGYLVLNQTGMVPYLVRAIQELQAEIDSLKGQPVNGLALR